MGIYIKDSHTLYTDQTFLDNLERHKLWRDREATGLVIKGLDAFGDLFGLSLATEIMPGVFLFDDLVFKSNQGIVSLDKLIRHYEEKTGFKPPPYIKGVLRLKQLIRRYKKTHL